MKTETFIRASIILVAVAVTCFILVPVYGVRPIEVVHVTNEVVTVATATPRPAPTASPTPEPAGGAAGSGAAASEAPAPEASPAPAEEPVLEEVLVEKSVDLNQASLEELDRLPGIGPALGQRIIDYREQNNGFYDIEEIMEVSGIGEAKFAELKDRITVDNEGDMTNEDSGGR